MKKQPKQLEDVHTYIVYVTKERAHGNETYVLLNNTSHNIPLGWFNVKDLNVAKL